MHQFYLKIKDEWTDSIIPDLCVPAWTFLGRNVRDLLAGYYSKVIGCKCRLGDNIVTQSYNSAVTI